MKILLVNQNSVDNLGDRAIYQATLDMLAAAFPAAQVTMLFHRTTRARVVFPGYNIQPSLDSWAYQIAANGTTIHTAAFSRALALLRLVLVVLVYRLCGRKLLPFAETERRATLCAFLEADLVLACGGGYIYDTSVPHGLLRQLLSIGLWSSFALGGMLLPLLLGKPLVLLPQSIGPLRDPLRIAVIRWIARRARLVCVREQPSYDLLKQIGAAGRVLIVPDLVFGRASDPHADTAARLLAIGVAPAAAEPLVGMTSIDWRGQTGDFSAQERYETAFVACIDDQTKQGARVVLFAQCFSEAAAWDDRMINRRLRTRAAHPERVYLHEEIVEPATLQALYGAMDFFIGTRMHSVILALNTGTPTVTIGYLHKSRGVMAEVGIGAHVIAIDHVSAATLIELVHQVQQQPAAATIRAYSIRAQRAHRALGKILAMIDDR